MKIERAEAIVVIMPLKFPFETSYGRETENTTVLVRLFGEGGVGWGEAAVSCEPDYCYETPSVSFLVLEKYLFPQVVGRDFKDPFELARALAHVKGYPFSKSGVESAFIDLYCKSEGIPAHVFLGGARESIPSGISLGIEDDSSVLFERIEWALEQGYKRLKLKIKPGRDISVVASVREAFGNVPMMVDANSSYSLSDLDRLKALDKYHLMMIEQPLDADDLADHAILQKKLRTHICLDESIMNIHDFKAAARLGSCRIVNIKFGRVGGLVAARSMAKECIERGVAVWCGGMLETGIGRAHNIALNSMAEFSLPGDISASDRYWEEDLIDPPVVMEEGMIEVPEGPGIGVQVVEKRVGKVSLDRVTVKA